MFFYRSSSSGSGKGMSLAGQRCRSGSVGGVGLDFFIHGLDPSVCPRMLDERGTVFDLSILVQEGKRMFLTLGLLAAGQGVIAEFDTVVGQYLLDLERILRQGVSEKVGGLHAFVAVQLQVDIPRGAVKGDEQVKLVLA